MCIRDRYWYFSRRNYKEYRWRCYLANNSSSKRWCISINIIPVDSRLAFVATTKNQIFSFTVSSATSANDPIALERSFAIANFTDLNPVLKDYDLGNTFRDFVVG